MKKRKIPHSLLGCHSHNPHPFLRVITSLWFAVSVLTSPLARQSRTAIMWSVLMLLFVAMLLDKQSH